MATEKPRFTITLDPSLLEQVHDYKEQNSISTQSKAIQKLIEIGISDIAAHIPTPAHTPALSFTFEEQQLINAWRKASPKDRRVVAAALEEYGFQYEEETSGQANVG